MNKRLPIYFALSNAVLVKSNGERLAQDELLKLWNFLNLLIGSSCSTFIMRGESDENLVAQYGYGVETPDLLAQSLFMAGEKGRICWNDRRFLAPDDTSADNFKEICRTLARHIEEGCRGNSSRSVKIREFRSRNEEFCSAFGNIDRLVGIYANLSKKERETVNLYYLSVAHTINSIGYKKVSSFVSTTTDAQKAKDFTDDAIIYGWVPRRMMSISSAVRSGTIDYVVADKNPFIKRTGLPCCDSPVYPEQKEVSMRCGLLPHFIIGFKVGRNFYVNPGIFESMDRMVTMESWRKLTAFKRRLINQGLEIDQTDFEEFCRKTNYRRYYTFDGYEYELHSLY